ncbi:MAG: Hint domain-containing homing endonuclease, partial [Gemmatimonadota bacterium]
MIELWDWQNEAVKELRANMSAGVMNQILASPTGCLAPGTGVLLASGRSIPVEDVEVGDRLLGPDGEVRTVLALRQGTEMMYRVTPKKGEPYVCNESHILCLKRTGQQAFLLADGRRIGPEEDIVDVDVRTYLDSTDWAKHCLKGWRSGPIEFPFPAKADVRRPVPPYILGAYLGDGTLGRAAISKPACRMVDEWEGWALGLGATVRTDDSGGTRCPSHHIRTESGKPNPAMDALREAGVLEERYVPSAYRYAPLEVRLELLAGLLDSDGHYDLGFDWITKDWRLAHDFAFLARSCGFACYLTECEKGIAETGYTGTYWRASLTGDLARIPTRDKRASRRRQVKRHLVHGITVEKVGEGAYYGFTLDGDGRFLLDDFTVTHNSGKTVMAAYIMRAAADRKTRCIFICDRIALINQTSRLFDDYDIPHGIIQA